MLWKIPAPYRWEYGTATDVISFPPLSYAAATPGRPHRTSKRDLSYDADFPNLVFLVFQHPIGFHHILAEHLRNGFNTSRWDSEFEPVSWARLPTVRQQMMRRGQILRQQPKLDQDSRLIPCNVFMMQTISANADDRGEGNPQFSTCGRSSRRI
jgi:hypothetical protein